MVLFHSYVQNREKNKPHYSEMHAEKVKLLLQCKEMIISGEKGSDFLLGREMEGSFWSAGHVLFPDLGSRYLVVTLHISCIPSIVPSV